MAYEDHSGKRRDEGQDGETSSETIAIIQVESDGVLDRGGAVTG